MFRGVLIANRGEIAVRAIRTLRRLGIKSVAVYSDPDRGCPHVHLADTAISLGGSTPQESFLRTQLLIEIALAHQVDGIFPGYGFLSENAPFARMVEAAGMAFIGPTPHQIEEFGLKHRARALATAAGVPLAPGTELLSELDEALRFADEIGYPIMLKSTAGGGGIGLLRCDDEEALRSAFESTQRLGKQYFGDSGVFLERYVAGARHVEVQILGDGKGHVVALGERDCSLQRRNQKVIEETPAPLLPTKTRQALLDCATRLGQSVNYRSAGTIEFIYDRARDEFYFLEVNTRLQVEHPITEEVTGLDLVEAMLQISSGHEVDWPRFQQAPAGHAIEARIYAENPLKAFQPSPGTLTEVFFPADVRIDGWVSTGSEVSHFYDPMLAKLIVLADSREAAIKKMSEALRQTRLHGIVTNLDYLVHIVESDAFKSADFSTSLLSQFDYTPQVIEVVRPGTQTTVQDYPGRVGYWDIGVPPSGPMDDLAFRLANRLVQNPENAAGLECTLEGPTLKFHRDSVIAITGAPCPVFLDDENIVSGAPVQVKAGQVLNVGRAETGCRTYIAFSGGLDVPAYLGSRSTFVLGKFGGMSGRALCAGDLLELLEWPATQSAEFRPASSFLTPAYPSEWTIGVLDGPHGAPDFFTPESMSEFYEAKWEVHYNSNRLGIRLLGPKPSFARSNGGEAGLHPSNIHDCEYAIGSINFTGDSPVILTHDGPSLGGFVCPVTIVKAELWKVGQLRPGDKVRFVSMTYEEALELDQIRTTQIDALGHSGPMLPLIGDEVRPRVHQSSNTGSEVAAILRSLKPDGPRPEVTYRQAGDGYILLEYGPNVLDLSLRMRVHLLMQSLKSEPISGIAEISPGVRSVQIRYDSSKIKQAQLLELLVERETSLSDPLSVEIPSRIIHLPMTFEDSATLGAVDRYRETVRANAPWLPNNVDFIQRINGLSTRDEVQQIVFSASYMVLGLGDVYLGAPCAVPLDPRHRLMTSKYNPARTFTAEGTVGIGGVYMCIYGMDSPGGYQLVGRTLPIWNKFLKNPDFSPNEPWLLRFFDQVRFYPVTEQELERQRSDFRDGQLRIDIEQSTFSFAQHQDFLRKNETSIANFRSRQKLAFDQEVEKWKTDEAEQATAALHAVSAEPTQLEGSPVFAGFRGNLWKVLVQPGDPIQAGQQVAIIEAMKIEMSVCSPGAGRVSQICCTPGKLVGPDDVILTVEAS